MTMRVLYGACVLLTLGLLAAAAGADDLGRADPAFPPDWRPEGIGGARELVLGAEHVELVIAVGGVEVTVPRDYTCRIGVREELPVLLARRGEGDKHVRITGRGPRGVTLDVTDVTMTRQDLGRVTPALQTLLSHDTHVMLDVQVAKETGSVPVHIVPERAYPVFAADVGTAAVADLKQALLGLLDVPVTYLHVSRDGRWLELAAAAPELSPRLVADISVDPGPAEPGPLARQHGHVVDFWQLQSVALAEGYGPLPPQEMEPIAARTREAARALREGDPTGLVLAPPLPAWHKADAPGAVWMAFLLGPGGGVGVQGYTIEYAPEPIAGTEPAKWVQADRDADLSAVRATFQAANAGFPVWWARVGAADGNPRLEALRAVRDFALAASAGAFGLEWRPLIGEGAEGGLWDPAGGVTEIGAALGEAMAELAGATSCYAWTGGERDCAWEAGSAITFRNFYRGDEGIVVLWSNLPRRATVRLGIRQEPLGLRTIIFSPEGRLIRRDTDLDFVAEQRPADTAYLVEGALAPLEVRIYTLPLRTAHRAWLADVTRRD